MNFYSCPRCSGKGYIDAADIERLDKTDNWVPGPCFYCNGNKTVDSIFTNNVSPSDDFLSIQRSDQERLLYAKDPKSFIEFNTIFFDEESNDEYRLKLIAAGIDAKKSIQYDYTDPSEISYSLIGKGVKKEDADKILTYITQTSISTSDIVPFKESDLNKPPYIIRALLCVALVVVAVILFKSIDTNVIVFRFIIGAVIIFIGKIIMSWGIS